MKTVSIGQFIDAIEKNGLRQTFGYYFRSNTDYYNSVYSLEETITSACAIGQACINLEVIPHNFASGQNFPPETKQFNAMLNRVVSLNDGGHLELDTIARKLREEFAEDLSASIDFAEFDYSGFLDGEQEEESK